MLKQKIQLFYKRLVRKYRVSFIDDETLYQTRQLVIKPVTAYLWGLLCLVIAIGGTTLLIFNTSTIREQIPGYRNTVKDAQEKEEMLLTIKDQNKRLIYLDSMLTAYQNVFSGIGDANAGPGQNNTPDAGDGNRRTAFSARQSQTPVSRTSNRSQETTKLNVVYLSQNDAEGNRNGTNLLSLFVPVRGLIVRKFNAAQKHYGVDIVAGKDELVLAATDGFVILAEYADKDGYVLGVANSKGVLTFYKHNSRLLKKVGSPVVAGEAIAVIGNSGENTTGPHLHFELWYKGEPVDPLDYYASFE